jgi:iron complex transport system ATP-binding protein
MEKGITLRKLSIGHSVKQPLIAGLTLQVNEGELIVLVGENGKGKTTLLRTLCGILPPLAGDVLLNGRSVSNTSAQQLATLVSVVLTEQLHVGNTTVKNLVSFGRYPYTNWLGIQSKLDKKKVGEAMDLCAIQHLADKTYSTLSDGERQKVMIARAITQDTPIVILDEPAAHLDITNRISIIQLLSFLSREKGRTVIYSTHQVELAIQYTGRLWLLQDGRLVDDSPKGLINKGLLQKAFRVEEGYFHLFDQGLGK